VENLTETLARRAVERSVGDRQASYAQEMQRIVDATYQVIQRTARLDPTLRDILRESGLSTQAFYKHFRSKDELLLLMLDDGCRRLVSYLTHRMDKTPSVEGRVRAWIEGVLAQAANTQAAARTRPFLANQDRLAEQFPAEQQASVDLLVGLLSETIARLAPGQRGSPRGGQRQSRNDAEAIYDMIFGALRRHLVHRTRSTAVETDHLVRFSLRAIGCDASQT
jgi:AcrR family transcriptional regulator